jgi:hypothetical protein
VVNLKNEFEQMTMELNEKEQSEIYKLKVLTAEKPFIFAGMDSANLSRQLYIDLGEETWEADQVNSLPKWRGISIEIEYFEKLFLLKKHYFLVLKQEDDKGTEIFEVVLQNLVDHLIREIKDDQSLFSSVFKVLDRWRTFFQRGGFKRLSDEQQRGLFGELWFINDWLDKNPGQPPLVIEQWEGPTRGRIDFKNSKCGLEIKTVLDKINKSIKISSENQLKISELTSVLFIYVCFLEQSKTHGRTLQDLASEVREKIACRSDRIALIYNDFLTDIGFREDEYADTFFFVENTEVYEAGEGFPRLIKEDLPVGISNVSYNVDLSHCIEFVRDKDEVDKYFRVDG